MSTSVTIFDDIGIIAANYLQQRLKLLRKLCGNRIIDLIMHMPSYVIEMIYTEALAQEHVGKLVTTKIVVTSIDSNHSSPTRPVSVYGTCGDSVVEISLFNYKRQFAQKVYVPGKPAYITGKLCTNFSGGFQFINPQKLVSVSEMRRKDCFSNVYPLTAGISQLTMIVTIKNALKILERTDIREWLPEHVIASNNFPSFRESLITVHNPRSLTERQLNSAARRRLCFDELLAEQLLLRLSDTKTKEGNVIKNGKTLISRLVKDLPFALTQSQMKVIDEIFRDLEGGKPMARLLQGDVGSGKTIVAIIASLCVIESGYQCAVLAPTEMLACQHYATFSSYLSALGISVEILTASEKGKRRHEILANIAAGVANVVIGTHAIISDGVKFHNLGFVVVDEQHRFGVTQRLRLITKGNSPHILSMTATPIPRTTIMSAYGDIAVSAIIEKPIGRSEVITKAIPINKISIITDSVKGIIAKGQKVYWVCPLIEESEKLTYTCVTNRFMALKEIFGDEVAMLHGRQKVVEKQNIFESFKTGGCNILVSTTVIEVGIDVPTASVIIIENAEKFGLAQLHQLRGRVGRSTLQSYCILLYDCRLSEVARKRLNTLCESNDGFYIAEQDLLLRGGGEILGTKQSCQKSYRTFDMHDPANNKLLLPLLQQVSARATNVIEHELIGKYDTLLKIFATEDHVHLKASF
ncbi:MAG: ATP-dependent DNA helicase RecG [Holosporales bacterium]|jgi:ATP-dependent DNA helicase RecG|nr:ATP-dependent DNA helicase RecG [Holosporales bacterium]